MCKCLTNFCCLNVEIIIGVIVTVALISVIIIASLIGTFIPLLLDKFGIDPALATGPFITTSNDICGILIYFSIAKMIDHSLLHPTMTDEEIISGCKLAKALNVATACVKPYAPMAIPTHKGEKPSKCCP